MKKLFAAAVALAMTLSMSTGVFADKLTDEQALNLYNKLSSEDVSKFTEDVPHFTFEAEIVHQSQTHGFTHIEHTGGFPNPNVPVSEDLCDYASISTPFSLKTNDSVALSSIESLYLRGNVRGNPILPLLSSDYGDYFDVVVGANETVPTTEHTLTLFANACREMDPIFSLYLVDSNAGKISSKLATFQLIIRKTKEIDHSLPPYQPDKSGKFMVNPVNLGQSLNQANLNAATVDANNTLHDLYDDRGNLIENVTLSTDGHVYFVPTTSGMKVMEAARGPKFANQAAANAAYEAAVAKYIADCAAKDAAYVAAVKAQ